MRCTNRTKSYKNIGSELFYGLIHFQVEQGNVEYFFCKGFPIRPHFLILKSVIIQQAIRNFLITCSNEDNMPPLLHLPYEVFKKVDICRMIDIDNNSHDTGCSSIKNRFGVSFFGADRCNKHSSFSPVKIKK